MRIATIVVNTPTHDHEYQKEFEAHAVYAALDQVKQKHPDWTSLCVVFLPDREDK